MLQNHILPGIYLKSSVRCEPDGCVAHNSTVVKEFMSATFPDRLISMKGTIPLPPRSPDVSPNVFCRGIYDHKINRTQELHTTVKILRGN